MKCPFCSSMEDKVIDSRVIKEGVAIRRRRQCVNCGARFTSYETIEEIQFMVVKKDGRREPFDRTKIWNGIQKACEKRPIPTDDIEAIVDDIETEIFKNRKEVPTQEIGETVIKALFRLDEIAYVRFASVYREFKDVSEFMSELKSLIHETKKNKTVESKKKS